MRILFMGTGEIGLPALRSLLDGGTHEVCGLICQPDKPAGRRQVLTPPPTKVVAREYGVPVFQPPRIRHEAGLVASLHPDVAVVMAYGQILPGAVLDAPRLGCLNLHASLLPRHRGASPVQAAILAGDVESGITVIYMDEGLDTGDILLTETLTLASDETGGSLHDRLAELAPVALARALDLLSRGTAPRRPQDHAAATHAGKLGRADGVIDWNRPADEVARRIRAFDPWPGTSTTLPDGGLLKIFPPVHASENAAGCALPGSIVRADERGLLVACGNGMLSVNELQAEGRRRMAAAAFLAGRPLAPGDKLGAPP
jgi:methionyl-tRNA formyltransferase